ncbi:MAG TPA: glycosyltransferase family 2 protein [Baekduia sp.]
MPTAIDIVVVSYNSSATLRDCVAPLAGVPGLTVTVVDNCSTDGAPQTVADLPVRVVAAERNGGFGYGCNRGAEAGDAPLVLFLNPDARIAPKGVARMAEVLAGEPGVAIVGPRLVEADGTMVPSMRRFQRAGSSWAQALFLHRLARDARWANEIVKDPAAYAAPASPEWLSGACMLVRREVLSALGGFDEGFFLYCEDMDLCTRARAAGHAVRFTPDVTVQHAGGQSAPRSSLYPVLAASRRRYARKHAGRLSAASQHAALAVHAATHVATAVRRPQAARGHAAAFRAMLSAPSP